MATNSGKANWFLGLVGAVVGGGVGYLLFVFLARQEFYALALPGALLGLGCGALSGGRSLALGGLCGLLALALGVFAEWRWAPWAADDSLPYFLTHLHKLNPVTLGMLALGIVMAIWCGAGSRRALPSTRSGTSPESELD